MKIDLQTVAHLERLAYLEFSPQQREGLLIDLNKILNFAAELKEVDLTGVAPMTHAIEQLNVLRPDTLPLALEPKTQSELGPTARDDAQDHNRAADQRRTLALQNAPQHDGVFYLVPKVLE